MWIFWLKQARPARNDILCLLQLWAMSPGEQQAMDGQRHKRWQIHTCSCSYIHIETTTCVYSLLYLHLSNHHLDFSLKGCAHMQLSWTYAKTIYIHIYTSSLSQYWGVMLCRCRWTRAANEPENSELNAAIFSMRRMREREECSLSDIIQIRWKLNFITIPYMQCFS